MQGNDPEITLQDLFEMQKRFADRFYNNEEMTEREMHDLSIKLASALHLEVSSVISQVNFRTHREMDSKTKVGNILHESVDIIRYTLGILNLWNISPAQFAAAYKSRDTYLNFVEALNTRTWDGRTPVVIVDLDDVISQFKPSFNKWLKQEYDVIETDSKSYYNDENIKHVGKSGQELLEEFVAAGELARLTPYYDICDVLRQLHSQGKIWIHILTARDDKNLEKKYTTIEWIQKHRIPCDRVSFAWEKYLWLTKTEYYVKNRVVCVIDDSPKNVGEFLAHGITCMVPERSYNSDLRQLENVHMYETAGYFKFRLEQLLIQKCGVQ